MDLLLGSINAFVLGSVPIILSYMNINNNLYLWITLLILSYLLSFGINALIQLVSCGSIFIGSIAKKSLWLPAFVTIFLGLSYIGFLSWAVEGSLPEMDSYTKHSISHGFYIFWGAFYGQLLSGGLVQSCS